MPNHPTEPTKHPKFTEHSSVSTPLRVVVAVPLGENESARLASTDARLDVVHRADLLPGRRHSADWTGDPAFRRSAADQQEFEALLSTADALYGIPDHDPALLARVVRSNPALRWVHTTAAGGGAQVRRAELTAGELERVVVTTSAGVHSAPLGEFALLAILMGAKEVPRLQRAKAQKEWLPRWNMRQLSQQTVLILGLGGIGLALADTLRALGATVIGVNRSGNGSERVDRMVAVDELGDVLADVDAVVSCLPEAAGTGRLVDRDFFSRVTPGVTFVNVGRGTAVDEDALVEALREGRVGFAALDVVAHEPLDRESPLWSFDNVLLSPHTAALTTAEEARVTELFARNAARLLDGEPLENVMDTVEFY